MKFLENTWFHPMFVHFPQALFPVSLASFLMYLATGAKDLETGAFITAAFGAAIAPATTITGLIDWKIRYQGYMTSVFLTKIVGAVVLIGFSVPAVLIRILVPDVAAQPLSGMGWVYGFLLAACTVTNVVLGHFGGKLIFH